MNSENTYATQNLYEASYLMARKFKLVGKVANGTKMMVGFEGEGVKQAALDFYADKKIGAKSFSDSYRTLKDYIFQR